MSSRRGHSNSKVSDQKTAMLGRLVRLGDGALSLANPGG